MKKIFMIGMLLISILTFSTNCVGATEIINDNLEVSLTTDKEEYENEIIKSTLTVINKGTSDVQNVKLEHLIPNGYQLVGKSNSTEVEKLEAGKDITLNIEITKVNSSVSNPSDDNGNSTNTPDSPTDTGDTSKTLEFIVLGVGSLLVIMFIKNRKLTKQTLSILLCASILTSTLIVSPNTYALEKQQKVIEISKTILSNKNKLTLNAKVYYDEPTQEEVDNSDYCKVNYALVIDKFVENADVFKNQKVKKGEKIEQIETPISKIATFDGWYTNFFGTEKFDFNQPIEEEITIYAKWSVDETDTDGDRVVDVIEDYYQTDPNRKDSDNDGLNDYDELYIGTNPLEKDTDKNGINDYNEDADNDGVKNGDEVLNGTDPSFHDTDRDGIDDIDEINKYHTDPIKEDTDGDGAEDGWEINHKYDPLVPNDKFLVTESSEKVTDANLVSATVEAELKGNQVTTLNVKKVEYADDPFASTGIPGYLGSVYDFSVDGEIESATLKFSYNRDVYGDPDEDFQPRIYYLNEETQLLEKLENQIVENGVVIAHVSHFSRYLLLNEVDFDKVWETEIKPPKDNNDYNGLDVVFVTDNSRSMNGNDKSEIRKLAMTEFIDKLNVESDHAGLVAFGTRAVALSELTNDFDYVKNQIESIVVGSDDTGSGTNASEGIYEAINILKKSEKTTKYMVFLTDGEDIHHTYSYDYLIEESNKAGITIYSIGLGSVNDLDEETLKRIAEETGGKYYHASAANNMYEIYDEIAWETADFETDSNNDGICDYYTELIKEGKLTLGNGTSFEGTDFNFNRDRSAISNDYDLDGLKNGEELTVKIDGRRVYLEMKSNPILENSDWDSFDDYIEVKGGSSALYYSVAKGYIYPLMNDAFYSFSLSGNDQAESVLKSIGRESLGAIFGIWNQDKIYRDIYIEYFHTYYDLSTLDNNIELELRKLMFNVSDQALSSLQKQLDLIDYYDLVSNVNDLKDTIKGFSDSTEKAVIKFENFMREISDLFPDIKYKISSSPVVSTLKKSSKVIDEFSDGLTMMGYALEIADSISSFAKVNANNVAFSENMDVLQNIYKKSSNGDAKRAAKDVMNVLEGNYFDFIIKAYLELNNSVSYDVLMGLLSEGNIYVAAFTAALKIMDTIFDISDDLENLFKVMSYYELNLAINRLLVRLLYSNNKFYELHNTDANELNRHLINLIQCRILGEEQYCEWKSNENLDAEKERIKEVKRAARLLNLKLSGKLD